jgi:peptide-methionine (S)-S-oxide reductase
MADLDLLNRLYNLILDRHVRDWEREQLLTAKRALEAGKSKRSVIENLEISFRPLALRETLTPAVFSFYQEISNGGFVGLIDNYRPRVCKSLPADNVPLTEQERAIFAGGCFWCMVEPFDEREGVLSVTSGFTGGQTDYPTYDMVCSHGTGHVEAVEILFDRRKLSYAELLEIYWSLINPTDNLGQFLDRGEQYRAIIFTADARQREMAERSKASLVASGKYEQEIVTEIRDATHFWPAEDHHQDWYKYNPKRYKVMEAARARYYKKKIFRKFWRKNNGKIPT